MSAAGAGMQVAWFDSQGRLDVYDDEIVDATRLAAILRDEWVLYGDESLDAPHVVQLLKPLQEVRQATFTRCWWLYNSTVCLMLLLSVCCCQTGLSHYSMV